MVTVREFEEAVWGAEHIRIVVRASASDIVEDYPARLKAAPETWTIQEWLDKKVMPKLPGKDVAVVDGKGRIPGRNTVLRNIRDTYPYDRA